MSNNKIQVRYAVQYATHTVTQAEYDLVYALYNLREPQKVQAIKFIRQQYGIGLKEAKDLCDSIIKSHKINQCLSTAAVTMYDQTDNNR